MTARRHERRRGGARVRDHARRTEVRERDGGAHVRPAEVRRRKDVAQVPHHGPPCEQPRRRGHHEGFLRVRVDHLVRLRAARDAPRDAYGIGERGGARQARFLLHVLQRAERFHAHFHAARLEGGAKRSFGEQQRFGAGAKRRGEIEQRELRAAQDTGVIDEKDAALARHSAAPAQRSASSYTSRTRSAMIGQS